MFRALFLLLFVAATAWGLTPQQVVVVYNEASELSRSTAELYARLRGIPARQLVPLKGLPVGEGSISRETYQERVVRPLLTAANVGDWSWPAGRQLGSRRMLALVLMPDLPLKVGAPKPKPGDKPLSDRMKASAAMDSELMLLGAGAYPLQAMLNNPCYGKDAPLEELGLPVLAVCRIDGPDAASIRRMVEDPVRVERQGLQGWIVVDEGGPYREGDVWLQHLAKRAREAGQPVFYETSKQTLSSAFPLMENTIAYFGWYTHLANGPFKDGDAGAFRFAPGAIAVHLHSFSAPSVKNARNWAAALLKRGAAVTAGNVDEPYLGPTLHFDIFYDRLLKGYALGEAALMASPSASWQCIVLGDPLYRPFAALRNRAGAGVFGEWRSLYWRARGRSGELRQLLPAYAKSPQRFALAEMAAWLCAEEGEYDAAYNFFAAACNGYDSLRDRTRTAILAATVLAADGEKVRAGGLLREWLQVSEKSPFRAALQASLEAIEKGRK